MSSEREITEAIDGLLEVAIQRLDTLIWYIQFQRMYQITILETMVWPEVTE
ncbi:MAG TPA: hypothetical protein VFU07_07190 [Candidatus Lumbricidophila sp.]|nr:hypothetical protein [Candidatus Lumbricidophila sp.]